MKIIHTSDWHIGQVLHHYDREDEHRHFFAQLAQIIADETPDALVVSGDIFHNPAPSASARKLFVDGVLDLHDACPDMRIVITAGNHDSGSRLSADEELWQRIGVTVVGSCVRNADGTFNPSDFVVDIDGKGYVLAVPFFHPGNFPLATAETQREERQNEFFKALLASVAGKGKPVVLMAHLAINNCDLTGHENMVVGGVEGCDIADLGDGYDYLALGHIHKPQAVGPRAYYSGSPIPMSFAEDYEHYVQVVDIAGGEASLVINQLEIKPLRSIRTLPNADGAPFLDCLESLALLNDECMDYVRLLVDQDDPLPADADDRANAEVAGKKCRLCEVKLKPKQVERKEGVATVFGDVDEFKVADPMAIAKESYKIKTAGQEMPTTLAEKLQLAIDNVKKRQNA